MLSHFLACYPLLAIGSAEWRDGAHGEPFSRLIHDHSKVATGARITPWWLPGGVGWFRVTLLGSQELLRSTTSGGGRGPNLTSLVKCPRSCPGVLFYLRYTRDLGLVCGYGSVRSRVDNMEN